MTRWACKTCDVFRHYLVPIKELYTFILTFALLCGKVLSSKILEAINYAWNRETNTYKFNCLGNESNCKSDLLGMLDVCRDCFAFLHACSPGKLQTLITSHKWKRSKARTTARWIWETPEHKNDASHYLVCSPRHADWRKLP